MVIKMEQINVLKEHIRQQLDGSYAHIPWYKVLNSISGDIINEKLPNVDYTIWDLLEHIRIAHWDILEFITNPAYVELKWPEDYWPKERGNTSDDMLNKSKAEINALYKKTEELLFKSDMDLFAKIPHGSRQTYLREFLLISEHNSYHFGQLVAYLKILGKI